MASSRKQAPGIQNNLKYNPVNVSFLSQQKVAASRCYNYVFIALRTRIYVYQPTYPSQTFPEKPLCILDSEPSIPSRGCIDPHFPHAINSLTIGDLGIEEVLVSAHDDGDICVWYTRDLSRIALRRNVESSAWGVALHKEKRLLAVSANSYKIHVFDLGVTEEERKAKKARRALSKDKKREDGVAIQWKEPGVKILEGHKNNIPNVSFLDDPSGNWLVGTAIDGTVIVWDVGNKKQVNATKVANNERGWSVLFLQPECFLPTRDEVEGLGRSKVKIGNTYDITPKTNNRDWGIYETDESELDEEESDDDEYYEDDDDVLSDDYMDPTDLYYHQQSEAESSVEYSMDEGWDEDEDGWDELNNLSNMRAVPRSSENNLLPASRPMANTRNNHSTVSHVDTQSPIPSSPKLPPQSFVFSTAEFVTQLFDVPQLNNIVICKNVPQARSTRQHFGIDRLNMVCAIPELSMVVVGNQMGRAAIYRLTQNEGGFMMRLEEIIPKEGVSGQRNGTSSEDQPTRPWATLLGMTVGPIQGREFERSRNNSEDEDTEGSDSDGHELSCQDPNEARARKRRGVWRGLEKRRRYRLFMVYVDGSILSYELGGTPDSEYLMV